MNALVTLFSKLDFFGTNKRMIGGAIIGVGGALGGALTGLAGVDIILPGNEILVMTSEFLLGLGAAVFVVGTGSAAAREKKALEE